MPCNSPVQAFRRADSVRVDKLGRVYRKKNPGITFSWDESDRGSRSAYVRCGKCVGCRLDWAGDWAARCEKEAQLWERNCFITLTYDDAHLPIGGSTRSSLSKRDFQLFMKRLRKEYGDGIRFFASGEYGPSTERAHYHALLFNHDFADKRLWKLSRGNALYVSSSLERLWPFGFSSVGAVTLQSAGYVARYVMKKLDGKMAEVAYADREPPFILMSRRPGIGFAWLEKFEVDVYGPGKDGVPRAELVVGDGRVRRPPRYFDEQFKRTWPERYRAMKAARVWESLTDVTPVMAGDERRRRMRSRETNLVAMAGGLSRPL